MLRRVAGIRENTMAFFELEHGTIAYRVDAGFYALAVVVVSVSLAAALPSGLWFQTSLWIAAGFAAWSVIEYAVHRFVLHGLQPFRRWHEAHHQRPSALIGAPTIVSASLIFSFVFLPTLAMAGPWQASAFTLGVLAGYLAYTVIHHAAHHWRGRGRWWRRRKRWHAQHHHRAGRHDHFGVITGLWDRAFGTTGPTWLADRAESSTATGHPRGHPPRKPEQANEGEPDD